MFDFSWFSIPKFIKIIIDFLKIKINLQTIKDSESNEFEKKNTKTIEYLERVVDALEKRDWDYLNKISTAFTNYLDKRINRETINKLWETLNEAVKNKSSESAINIFKVEISKIKLDSKESQKNCSKESLINSKDRRKFVIGSTALGLGGLGGYLARPKINSFFSHKWEMSTFLLNHQFGENGKHTNYPPFDFIGDNEIILSRVPYLVSQRIYEMTDGSFRIGIRSEPISDSNQAITQVSNGIRQCSFSGLYYNDYDNYSLLFGVGIPFGLNVQEQTAWLYYTGKGSRGGLTIMQKEYQNHGLNIIAFPAAATGSQMGGWFHEPIRTIDDFIKCTVNDRYRMRIPGLGAKVLEDNFLINTVRTKKPSNESKVTIPANKIAEKLRNGEINSAEFIGPYDDMVLDLHNANKQGEKIYYYHPGWHETASTFDIQVNTDYWEKLPKTYQEIFKAACAEIYVKILAEYEYKNSRALVELKNKAGKGKNVLLRKFPDEVLKELYVATQCTLKSLENEKGFKEIYSEWRSFRDDIRNWTKLNQFSLSQYKEYEEYWEEKKQNCETPYSKIKCTTVS
ncbi:MAG: hypothetical protein H6937_00925 [Burkholderiales bacterium]|nr:hypothetical protein [Burkholderiales bacterium]MDR4518294.1 hypothetical protein [Nitrosomonas sp.]